MAVSKGAKFRNVRIEPMWFDGFTFRRGVVLVQKDEYRFFIWNAWGPRMTWEQTEDCQFCVDRFITYTNSSVVSNYHKTTYKLRTPTYYEARIIEEHCSEIHKVLKEIGSDNLLTTTLWTQEEIDDNMAWALDGGKLTETPKSFKCLTMMVADW